MADRRCVSPSLFLPLFLPVPPFSLFLLSCRTCSSSYLSFHGSLYVRFCVTPSRIHSCTPTRQDDEPPSYSAYRTRQVPPSIILSSSSAHAVSVLPPRHRHDVFLRISFAHHHWKLGHAAFRLSPSLSPSPSSSRACMSLVDHAQARTVSSLHLSHITPISLPLYIHIISGSVSSRLSRLSARPSVRISLCSSFPAPSHAHRLCSRSLQYAPGISIGLDVPYIVVSVFVFLAAHRPRYVSTHSATTSGVHVLYWIMHHL